MKINHKKSFIFLIILWLLVFLYLLFMNSGISPLYIKYDINKESPFVSKLWPASNYKVENEKVVSSKSIYLDVKPTVDFENMKMYLAGVCVDNCEMKLVVKENFESGALLMKDIKFNEWMEFDLSFVPKNFLLVFDFSGNGNYEISDLVLQLNNAKWLKRFK